MNKIRYLIYALLALAALAFGLSAPAAVIFAALLSLFYVMSDVRRWAVCVLGLLAASYCVLRFDILNALLFTLQVGVLSFFLSQGLRKKKSLAYTMITATVAMLAVTVCVIVYQMQASGLSAFTILFGDSFNSAKEIFEASEGQSEQITQMLDLMATLLELIIPSLLILSGVLIVYIAFGITRAMMRKNNIIAEQMPYFSNLRMSSGFSTVFLVILMASMFAPSSAITFNIVYIVAVLFAVCGLSVVDFNLRKPSLPAFVKIGIIIAEIILFTAFFYMLAILGIVDSYRPLRKMEDSTEYLD